MSDQHSGPPAAGQTAAMPRRDARKAAVAFVLITVCLDVLALGITVPILPKLVETMLGGDTARAAILFGLFTTAWALMQFLFQPLMGALSDRYGRRPVILLSNLGLGLDYILMALAPTVSWLFVGRVISGIAASSFSTATAYIADVTAPDKRAEAFGLIGVAFGFGFVLGPAVGGLLGAIDPRLPLWVAAGLSLANALYGFLVLPESLTPDKRAPFRWARANPLGALRLLASHPQLMGLSGSMFLYHMSHNVFPAIFVLHAGYRFGWGEAMVGLGLAGFAVCSAIVQGLLIKPVVGRFGERRMLLFGMAVGVVGFLMLGLANTSFLFWLGMPVMALWSFIGPAMQGIMTRHVGASEQGRLQGAISSLGAIAGLIAPIIFSQLFAWAISAGGTAFSGAPYLLAGAFIAAAGALGWRVTRDSA
jgi:DHA1 family tetracycline resistance protein-like MFS transporter